MRGRNLSIILEECLQRLDRGEDLPDLLAEFPEQRDQLKPLLLVAMASRTFPVPVPSETAQRLGRNQMLAEMNRLEILGSFRKKPTIPPAARLVGSFVKAARARGFTHLAYSYRLAMVALMLVLSGGFFTLNASASSQPGSLLSNLKLSMQGAGLTLSHSDQPLSRPEEQPFQIPEPWEFGQIIWALEGIPGGYQYSGSDIPDAIPENGGGLILTADPDDQKDESKDLRDAEKEAAQDLKEEEKTAAEAEKEAALELKEEEKDAARDLREEEKEAAEAARESEKDEKEADKIEKERIKDAKEKEK